MITSVLWFGIGSLYANKAKSKTDSQHFTFIPFGVNNYSIQGSLKLTDSNIGGTASDCFGTGGYSDIEAAMPVTVRDGQGKILATGRTSSGSYPVGTQVWSSECTFTFQVDNVPKSDFYTIEVGRRGGLNYSFEEIQKQNWKVSLSLGS